MKVIVENATGSSKLEALLDKDSGVIEFQNGELSHILFEKQFNKKIYVMKDAPKLEEVKAASDEQSKPVKGQKVKSK